MKTLLAVFLAAAAALTAAGAAAAPSGENKDLPLPGYAPEDLRQPAPVAGRRARETQGTAGRREGTAAPPESPARAEPTRPLPGDVPEKTTTSGSLDREGRVLDEQRTAPPPPPPGPLGEEPHSAPPPR